jgi:hypothetical protein
VAGRGLLGVTSAGSATISLQKWSPPAPLRSRAAVKPRVARRPRPVLSPGTYGCPSVKLPPAPENPLRRVAAVGNSPARGRASSAMKYPIITIRSFAVTENMADKLEKVLLILPYVAIVEYMDIMTTGGRSPCVDATSRRYRLLVGSTRSGRAWLAWTAPPCRELLNLNYKYTTKTRTP